MRIVIVGGGTAGWMAASYYSKFLKNCDITVVESSKIPKIGVGESVTPHVSQFFKDLGFDTHEWMRETGSIYKLANKFLGWKEGKNEYEYFSFSYPTDTDLLYRDINKPLSPYDLPHVCESLTTDYALSLFNEGLIDRFDKYFNSQFYYMERNVAPFYKGQSILNSPFGWTQHINADLAANFLKDRVSIPNGVRHIDAKVTEVKVINETISSIVLDNDQILTADLFLDATGFSRILTKALGRKTIEYKNSPADRAWVCQLDYLDPYKEMVNYTQSIAKSHGWMFKIGLYHRMGCGLVFGSKFQSDEKALEQYLNYTSEHRKEPRLIKWSPGRLEKIGNGNCVAIGLSSGFTEPLEANALFIIVNSIRRLFDVIVNYQKTNIWEFDKFNEIMSYSIDDIRDFILVHYTLSSRKDSDLWLEMQDLGQRENHEEFLYYKYKHQNNTMKSALEGYTMFPQYMWAQWATVTGIDTSKWYNIKKDDTYELTKLYLEDTEKRHNIISKNRQNSYEWLKQNVFNNLTFEEWESMKK